MNKIYPFIACVFVCILINAAFAAGWDSNLTKRCAKTTGATSSTNYYHDSMQCDISGEKWTLAVESEAGLGMSCPGPVNQSYLINGSKSPISLNWINHISERGPNWTVDMKVDHISSPPTCAGPIWTWFAFMDHVNHGGGPLPAPHQVTSSHMINYSHWAPSSSGGARLIAGAQFWWGGNSHLVEIHLAQLNWGKAHPHPGVIQRMLLPDGTEYIALYGDYWGVSVTPGIEKSINIPWNTLINQIISNGWFSSISGSAATSAIFLAIEVKDHAIAELWHTNFRIQP